MVLEAGEVNELLETRVNQGLREPLYFWRNNIGTEIDVVMERGNALAAVEIKSGITVASDAFRQLDKWHKYATERGQSSAVYRACSRSTSCRTTSVCRWQALFYVGFTFRGWIAYA